MAPRKNLNWAQILAGWQSCRHYTQSGRSLEQTLRAQRNVSIDADQIRRTSENENKKVFAHSKHREDSTTTNGTAYGEAQKDGDYSILLRLGHIQQPQEDASSSEESFIVRFTDNDHFNPQTWSRSRKYLYTFFVGLVGFITTGSAAIESGICTQASAEFYTPQNVEMLSTSLYLIAFGLGTLVSAPFSETLGRNMIYLTGLLFFMFWTVGAALAPNIQTQLLMRFLMGLFGSPPAVAFGGSISDLWSPLERVYIFPILSFLTFLGPFLAPVVASYIATSPLDLPSAGMENWHFVSWLTLILSAATLIGIAGLSRETYAPVLLSWKAEQLRRVTGDERYKAPSELDSTSLGKKLLLSLKRPWIFLFREPIVALFSVYLIVIYVVLYGSLVSWQYIFGRTGEAIYYFSQREVGLSYLPINLGFLVGLMPLPWLYKRYKTKLNAAHDNGVERLQPEEHLWFAMLGAPCLPIALIWLALSSKPEATYWSPLVASILLGVASLAIFVTCYQYIIDIYEEFAASALVGMTFTRYVATAPMVVAADYMYSSMGVRNAELVWFAIAVIMTPVPYFFYYYGPPIRSKSTRATDFGTEYKPEPKEAVMRKIKS